MFEIERFSQYSIFRQKKENFGIDVAKILIWFYMKKLMIIKTEIVTSNSKWVISYYVYYGVNSLRLGVDNSWYKNCHFCQKNFIYN